MTAAWTIAALLAFAANSVLCRLALSEGTIDAVSFTALRLISGALLLMPVSVTASPRNRGHRPAWPSSLALFCYAIAFSTAYLSLTTGTGALLLFGGVQSTMLLAALAGGERPGAREWIGVAGAMAGCTCWHPESRLRRSSRQP